MIIDYDTGIIHEVVRQYGFVLGEHCTAQVWSLLAPKIKPYTVCMHMCVGVCIGVYVCIGVCACIGLYMYTCSTCVADVYLHM